MKCLSCDVILTDREATRKSINTGEYLDLCNHCLSETDIVVHDLPYDDYEEEVLDEHVPTT